MEDSYGSAKDNEKMRLRYSVFLKLIARVTSPQEHLDIVDIRKMYATS
ncbi:hypothetical protein EV213_12380 [Aureibacillus halotolerans]|uniref:Uncharacterized protein n=1 Tax=Aureibacillus halotolerans TaxID=1508390 RepID=A0A4R6TU53_9BACI|nr:hypothetical protein EV213_12380 [Aureibacillus halotolerans]